MAESSWAPSLVQRLVSFGAYALTRETLSRLLSVMNDKQNKTMRQLLLGRLGVGDQSAAPRGLWFVRIDQTWESFLEGISEAHLREIAAGDLYPREGAPAAQIVQFLERHGIDLGKAREYYDAARAKRANAVQTNFTGLADGDIDALERHAMWQVWACRAVYGPVVTAAAVARG